MTCLENNITENYDICIIDTPLNDLFLCEMNDLSEDYCLGSIYSLLNLFNKSKCKLMFIKHKPKTIDCYNYHFDFSLLSHYSSSITIVDLSTVGVFENSDDCYQGATHYCNSLQYKVAKYIKIITANYDILPFVKIEDICKAPSFKLLSQISKYSDKFDCVRNTSLASWNNWLLNYDDSFEVKKKISTLVILIRYL